MIVILSCCVAKALGNSLYYGYALPSGYASASVNGISPSYIPRTFQTSPKLNYYSPTLHPIPSYNSYFNPIAQSNSVNQYSQHAFGLLGNPIPAHQTVKISSPAQPAAAVSAAKPAPFIAKTSNDNQLAANPEEGFKLLADLIDEISSASGTAADTNPDDVAAVKSIFPDIIDEVIRQIGSKFDGSLGGVAQKDAFIQSSKATKQALDNAPTQTIISSILKPYVASLKEFTYKGLQAARSLDSLQN